MNLFNKRLFILRHGETEFNKAHILQGQTDSPLTELGVRQANEAAEKAKGLKIDILVSSDLRRAVRTAEIISSISGVRLERTDPAFRERSFGKLEGVLIDELEAYPQFAIDDGIFILEHDFPTAEPIKSFYSRVTTAIENLMKEFKGKNVMLICHKGVLHMMYAYANGVPLDKIRKVYNPINCEIENY